jgi:hypothetical protein
MWIYQRATKLYNDVFHRHPNFEMREEAEQYALLEKALRDVVDDCKTVAEQHATQVPQNLWGEGARQAASKIAFLIGREVGK